MWHLYRHKSSLPARSSKDRAKISRKFPQGGVSCYQNTRLLYTDMCYSSEAIIEIKGRMSTLESSINHLINLSTKPNVDIHSPRDRPKKRARADIQNEGFSPYITTGSESHLTPPFSAFEACTLIQDELGRVPSLSMKKQAAFHSALSSLRQSLNTSIINHDFPSTTISEEALGHLSIPPLSLIQWMLQCKTPMDAQENSDLNS